MPLNIISDKVFKISRVTSEASDKFAVILVTLLLLARYAHCHCKPRPYALFVNR